MAKLPGSSCFARLLPFLCLLPCLLLSIAALVCGILCLVQAVQAAPIFPLVFFVLFLLSAFSAVMVWQIFQKSGRQLTLLLREYGTLPPEADFPLFSLFTQAGRDQIFRSVQEYSGRISQLQFLRNQAEYTAHQSQINPHFLYNTLDTIRGKAMEYEQDEIADMIESLSRIFRYSISNKSDMFILKDELKNVKDYIKIQQIRFANRFSFQYSVDEEDWRLMYFRVPKLILQPLVENALLHGLESMVSGGTILLSAYRTEQLVILRVSDNGQGMPTEKVKALCAALREGPGPADGKKGIALTNISQRIKYIFGPEYGLTFSSTEGRGTTVEIIMPYTEVYKDGT